MTLRYERWPATAHSSAPRHEEIPQSKQRRHRVVLESVTQEKKKLRSVFTFEAKPPPGYTFIPAGNPELTNALKDFAREEGYKIFAVTNTRHQDAHDLSKEVHRIGFHFPSVVVDQVCAHYGITLSSAGTLIKEDEVQSFRQRYRKGKKSQEKPKDQITVNTEARDAIKDLFPNIPDNDMHQIIKTAFQKGRHRVGTANELPLIRRAQLSVVAHIRHMYTDYDQLLRDVGYNDARGLVEAPTLRKLVEWRGDDETGKDKLEDVFREVIVISDNEDSDDDLDDEPLNGRSGSVEVISRTADDTQIELMPINYAQRTLRSEIDLREISEDEAPTGFRYVPQIARRRQIIELPNADVVESRRYEAWDRARAAYRANPVQTQDAPLLVQSYNSAKSNQKVEVLPRETFHPGQIDYEFTKYSHGYRDELQEPIDRYHREPPDTLRGPDGAVYQRAPRQPSGAVYMSRWPTPPRDLGSSGSHPGHTEYQQNPARNLPDGELRTPTNHINGSAKILPSIEPADFDTPPRDRVFQIPSHVQSLSHRRDGFVGTRSAPQARAYGPEEVELVELTDNSSGPEVKRRRLENPFFDSDVVYQRHPPVRQMLPPPQDGTYYIPVNNPTAEGPGPSSRYEFAESNGPSSRVRPVSELSGPDRTGNMFAHPSREHRTLALSRSVEVLRDVDRAGSFPSHRAMVSDSTHPRFTTSVHSRTAIGHPSDSFVSSHNPAERDLVPSARPGELVAVSRRHEEDLPLDNDRKLRNNHQRVIDLAPRPPATYMHESSTQESGQPQSGPWSPSEVQPDSRVVEYVPVKRYEYDSLRRIEQPESSRTQPRLHLSRDTVAVHPRPRDSFPPATFRRLEQLPPYA